MNSGFLLIDKPEGITSHDVVYKLRKITEEKKIGHAGTLDPFATGLLILAITRRATKHISKFVGLDKVYDATFILGATTDSLDPETEIRKSDKFMKLQSDEIEESMQKLTGAIKQVPPMHSAIKVKGKKLYELARKGEEIKRDPRNVTIHEFDLLGKPRFNDGVTEIDVRISCSSGTYIRAIARDLAQELETDGYVRTLRRTSIGNFDIKNAVKLEDLNSQNWLTFLKSLEEMGIDAK